MTSAYGQKTRRVVSLSAMVYVVFILLAVSPRDDVQTRAADHVSFINQEIILTKE